MDIREKIVDIYTGYHCGIKPLFDGCGICAHLSEDGSKCEKAEEFTDQIISLLKPEGWVQLDSDQGLPAIDEETYSPLYVMAYSTVKRAMLNAGFKKVEE
uniref:Uncharacterized protein n=1 Tax=viral metagenome TaxID=1070528 RepID=A0A6M3J439_9ZZZZ